MGFNIRPKGRNLWALDVRVRQDGKRLRKRETFKGTKAEAEERYIALRTELKQAESQTGSLTLPLHPIRTFGEMLDLYLEKKGKMSSSHRNKYERLKKELGNIALEHIGDKFEALIKIMRKYPSKTTGKILADAFINRIIEIARAVFTLAVDLEIIEKNPITKVRFQKRKETPRDVMLTKDQIENLFEVINQHAPHLKAIVQFALQVPCRRSELVNMRRADLDLINNAIRVKNGTTKNDAGCWKPVPPDMVEYFRNLPAQSEYLFYRYDQNTGNYVTLGDFKKAWKTSLRIAGIEDLRFHDTRHIAATALLDNGTPARIVQEVAGWKTDMLRTYYHRGGKSSFNLIKFSKSVHCGYTSGDTKAASG
ncbi:MAG: site-specific integrase [Chitinispirillaceae bacterium]|nr:site-specific integrase [Chitinispirillaceae bacterium]